jgi:hypothetical protein
VVGDQNRVPPEQPRSEPEIILPGEPLRSSRTDNFAQWQGVHRIYIARPGPFGMFAVALAIIAAFGIVLLLLWGALLIIVPMIALLVVAGIISGVVRSYFRGRR